MKKRLAKRLLALLTTAALFVGMLSSAAFAGSTATVTRLSGDDRYDTAYEVVDEAFSGSQYAVIASGTDYPDALSAAALAGALDAPVIITSDNEAADTVAELESLGTTFVYIVGGTSSVSEDVEAAITAAGITVSRIAGADRTETSVAVAAEVLAILGDEASGTCFVATGATYADALSASAYAYYTASPIFLTDTSGNITEEALDAIEEGGYSNVVILGGENSVTRESAGSILSIFGVSAIRLGGEDRYETSAAIAAWSAKNGMTYDNAAVASGTNFADALSASSLCGQNGSVLLLAASTADDSTVLAAALKENAEDISNLYIIGGTSSVSSGIYNMIADIIGASYEVTTVSADDAIVGISTLGSVEADGAKPYAIIVEYNVDLTGADVSADTYDVWDYWLDQGDSVEIGSDPGAVTEVYVNNEAAVSEDGGSGSGNYVIIELNMDYQVSRSATYYLAMAASITQIADISADSVYISAGSEVVTNYDVVTYEETNRSGVTEEVTEYQAVNYTIDEVDRYTIDVYHATECFEEATGEYIDVDLDYALFVPEDYDDSQEYMLVLHIEDAGSLGTDAMLVLTEAQTPVNLISDDIQQIAKDQGYGGVIVVCPQVDEDYRSARDNYTTSAVLQATWKLLDELTAEYNIDMDRIYGTGQSMGGMQVLYMASMRDNYFAAVMPVGCQWGSNYNKEDEYEGEVYYATPVDDVYVLSTDAQGNECDYQNWYYMLSDDNILSINCLDDAFSSTVWTEFSYLYSDLAGVEIPHTYWNPLTTDIEDQNTYLEELLASDNETGIYWASFEGGSHMSTWVYAANVDAIYEWLLTQTASSETERGKIACLANDFELADEQIETEERLIYTDDDGTSYYYVTGKSGAGTAGYNSGLYNMNGAVVRAPGWVSDDE